MAETGQSSDKRTGVSLVFGLLAVASAAYLLVAGPQVARAFGFGLAMVLAACAVAAVHLYA